jgi:hypothetical protein
MPLADYVSQFNNTCGECGKSVRIYGEGPVTGYSQPYRPAASLRPELIGIMIIALVYLCGTAFVVMAAVTACVILYAVNLAGVPVWLLILFILYCVLGAVAFWAFKHHNL